MACGGVWWSVVVCLCGGCVVVVVWGVGCGLGGCAYGSDEWCRCTRARRSMSAAMATARGHLNCQRAKATVASVWACIPPPHNTQEDQAFKISRWFNMFILKAGIDSLAHLVDQPLRPRRAQQRCDVDGPRALSHHRDVARVASEAGDLVLYPLQP